MKKELAMALKWMKKIEDMIAQQRAFINYLAKNTSSYFIFDEGKDWCILMPMGVHACYSNPPNDIGVAAINWPMFDFKIIASHNNKGLYMGVFASEKDKLRKLTKAEQKMWIISKKSPSVARTD